MNAFNPEELHHLGVLAPIDLAFCRLIQRLEPQADDAILLAAALVSRAAGQGHVCLDLQQIDQLEAADSVGRSDRLFYPDPENWARRLAASTVVGRDQDFRPMILDGSRLYLQRFWRHEQDLAQAILKRCRHGAGGCRDLETTVERFFGASDGDQRRAAILAATLRFCVISGGPGTGKTHTLARILAMLFTLEKQRALRIALSAPTGKAAARLKESIDKAIESLGADAFGTTAPLPEPVTLHRLLGYQPARARFAHTADNPLPADVVIVDEASMVDLVLMSRLFRAVSDDARLILTGDKDQLASVEAGAVLGDICHGIGGAHAADAEEPPLASHIAVLRRNYRFATAGGIGALSRAINNGEAGRVLDLLTTDRSGRIQLRTTVSDKEKAAVLGNDALHGFEPVFDCHDPRMALSALNTYKILAVLRHGPWGVGGLNAWIEQLLREKRLIDPHGVGGGPAWYPGKPVMITRNDYHGGLFNGDIGVTVADETTDQNRLSVVFPDNRGGLKHLAPYRLPPHETVYAMTVHKSQGSEFDHVALVLPDQDVPVLTRELLYTAVTRARESVTIYGRPDVVARAVGRRVKRFSGLRRILWPDARKCF